MHSPRLFLTVNFNIKTVLSKNRALLTIDVDLVLDRARVPDQDRILTVSKCFRYILFMKT